MDKIKKIILLKDKDWTKYIGTRKCKVLNFTPMSATVKNNKVKTEDNTKPYGYIDLNCEGIEDKISGYITHKNDFLHFWNIYKVRGLRKNEELLITVERKRGRLSPFFPKFKYFIHKKGYFKRVSNPKDIIHSTDWWTNEKYKKDREILKPILTI